MELLSNITLGQYIPGDSLIHNLDGRTKIIILFFLILGIFLINSWLILFFLFFIFLGAIFSKISFFYLLRGIKSIYLLILITLFFNLFFTPGEIFFNFYFLKITKSGFNLGILTTLRLIFLVLFASLITLTTSSVELTDALEKLMLPLKKIKVPVHEIAMMMTIALRFIPTLIQEADKIIKAQMSKGAEFERGNIFRRSKNLIPVLVPLFIHAFKSAEDLAVAMETRLYRTGVGRRRLREKEIRLIDLRIILIVGGFLILLSSFEHYLAYKFL